jgi:hypothetical protein
MSLLQRSDPRKWLTSASSLPILQQFLPVEAIPFKHERQGAPRKMTVDAFAFDLHGDLVLAIDSVKVRNAMLAVEHADHDSEEA